jgi:hypothetical protein
MISAMELAARVINSASLDSVSMKTFQDRTLAQHRVRVLQLLSLTKEDAMA